MDNLEFITTGILDVKDEPHTNSIFETLNKYFDTDYNGWQQAKWISSNLSNFWVWFPQIKFDKNNEPIKCSSGWINDISNDNNIIISKTDTIKQDEEDKKYVIIFPWTNEYDDYIFKGVYKRDNSYNDGFLRVYKRVATKVEVGHYKDTTDSDTIHILEEVKDDVDSLENKKFIENYQKYIIDEQKSFFNFQYIDDILTEIEKISDIEITYQNKSLVEFTCNGEWYYIAEVDKKKSIDVHVSVNKNKELKNRYPSEPDGKECYDKWQKRYEKKFVPGPGSCYISIRRNFKNIESLIYFVKICLNSNDNINSSVDTNDVSEYDSDTLINLTEDEVEEYANKYSMDELKKQAVLVSNKPNKKSTKTIDTVDRKAIVSEYVKRRAEGICDLCGNKAPFINKNGKPYLESHHVKWLSKGGEDSINNAVALCPNCHRKMHICDELTDVEKLLDKLLSYKDMNL